MRTFLSLQLAACLIALLSACGHATKPQQTSQAQPAQPSPAQTAQPAQAAPTQMADATPLAAQPDLPESQPLDQNGQPVSQPAPVAPPASPPLPATRAPHAKPSPARTAPAVLEPPPSIDIPAGTVVRVRLDQTVGTKHSRRGDRFRATLISAVVARGETVIPRGTLFEGHVLEAKQSGRFKGRAVLSLALDSFWLKGVRYPVGAAPDTAVSGRHRKRNWALMGGGAGLGATLGAVAGGGAGALIGAGAGATAGTIGAIVTGHKNVTFHAETPLTFRLRYDVAVSAAQQRS